MRVWKLVLVLWFGLVFYGCGGNGKDGDDPKNRAGREETRKIRAADSIGYAGSAIANRLDKTLDQTDRRKQQIDQTGADTAKP